MTPRPAPTRLASLMGAAQRLPGLLVLLLLAAVPVTAQQNANAPVANWAQFDRFSSENLGRFIHTTSVQSNWIHETDSLWYSWEDRDGTRFHLVDPSGPQKRLLFDHERMASLLSQELETYLEAHDLPIEDLEFSEDGRTIEFTAKDVKFEYHLDSGELTNLGEEEEEESERPWRNFSPDSTAYVYAEEHNLYFVEIVDGVDQEAVQLTTDGEEEFSFGNRDVDEDDEDVEETDSRVRPNVNWSEDGRAFSVTRNDRRLVGKLYLVNVLAEPRPELEEYRYQMPGEEHVPQHSLYAFNRDRVELRPVDVDRFKDQRLSDIHWTNGSADHLRMVRRARSQRYLELIEVDMATDQIRVLLTEGTEWGRIIHQNVRYLGEDNSGDFIWFSRRTGWAHYYRYDHDGNLRNAITSGTWNARNIQEVNEDNGRIWFTAVGREAGENVNYTHLYRVQADGSGLTLLDPGDADHNSSLSPNQRFVLNTYSRTDQAPRSVLRDQQGNVVLELEEMDVSELEEFGWEFPERLVMTAADGVTRIYGNMWKPFDFDPTKSYPVINYVYPGPQTEAVTTGFRATSMEQELAQLGFIVVQVGNRGGTPLRSAAYHSHGYFDLRDYGLADKKAGIEELGKRHPWIDVTRVGIFGHSGGGFMTAAALLVPPYNEFFTVGVSSAGNHDNNVYNQNWSESNHGLEVTCVPRGTPVASTDEGEGDAEAAPVRREARVVPHEGHCEAGQDVEFDIHVPANHEVAEHLKGRLLLQHGDMDNNVHHVGTMRLVRELMRHNKRFDFMMMPGMRHGFGSDFNDYWRLARAEYFARYLLGDNYFSADMLERR